MRYPVLLILMAAIVTAGPALGAPGDWNIFLNASVINSITPAGDTLLCATNGGVLLFDLSDSSFTQLYDGLELRSTDLSRVVIDSGGSLWLAFRSAGIARIDDPGGSPVVVHYNEAATANSILSDSVRTLVRAGDEIYYGCDRGVGKFYENLPSPEPNLSDSLEGKIVNDLFIDSTDGYLWIASEEGVGRFDRETFMYRLYPIGHARSICEFQGSIYCATDEGVRVFDGDTWSDFGSSFNNRPPLVVAGGEDIIYCATAERLFRHTGSFWTSVAAAEMKSLFRENYRIGVDHIRALAIDSNGTPWIGGGMPSGDIRGSYLSGYYGGGWENKAPSLLTQNNTVALDVAPDGGLWASTRWGISYRSGAGDWISYTKIRSDVGHDDALSYYSNNLALLYDSDGLLWCNAPEYDLDMIDIGSPLDRGDDVWTHYSIDDGTSITSNRFVRAKEDPAGNRWFLSDNDYQVEGKWGINIASQDISDWLEVNPLTAPGMGEGGVFDCFFGSGGVYLAIRGFGVQYWTTGGFGWSSLEAALAADQWETLLDEDNLPNTELTSLEVGADNSIWVGTSGGLIRYRSGVVDSFTLKTVSGGTGLVGNLVYDIEFDPYGNLWVATNQGLNRINSLGEIDRVYTTGLLWTMSFQFIYPPTVISPLPSHTCKVLACDAENNYLYIGTDRGIARLDVTPGADDSIPVSEAILYPNPVYISRGDNSLRIARISGAVDIKVYNMEGELVHEASGITDGGEAWDLLTLNGFKARSGIYIVRISGEGRHEVRKVAVIK